MSVKLDTIKLKECSGVLKEKGSEPADHRARDVLVRTLGSMDECISSGSENLNPNRVSRLASPLFKIGDKVAALGCNSGPEAALALQIGCRVLAVDDAPGGDRALAVLKWNYRDKINLVKHPISPDVLPKDGSFDTIWSLDAFDHCSPKDIVSLIDSVYDSLKAKGKFIFSLPLISRYRDVEEFLKEKGFRVIAAPFLETEEVTFYCRKNP